MKRQIVAFHKFPIADRHQLPPLQADFSNQNVTQLGVVSGVFKSPVWDMHIIWPQSAADWKSYGRLLFWEWYSRHPEAATDTTRLDIF